VEPSNVTLIVVDISIKNSNEVVEDVVMQKEKHSSNFITSES
jgi:hypothetical protein